MWPVIHACSCAACIVFPADCPSRSVTQCPAVREPRCGPIIQSMGTCLQFASQTTQGNTLHDGPMQFQTLQSRWVLASVCHEFSGMRSLCADFRHTSKRDAAVPACTSKDAALKGKALYRFQRRSVLSNLIQKHYQQWQTRHARNWTLTATLARPAQEAHSASCLGLAQGQRRAERPAQRAYTCAARLLPRRAARLQKEAQRVAPPSASALHPSPQQVPSAQHPCALPQRAHRVQHAAHAARHDPAAAAQPPAGELRPPGLRACRRPARPPRLPPRAGGALPGAPRLHAHATLNENATHAVDKQQHACAVQVRLLLLKLRRITGGQSPLTVLK